MLSRISNYLSYYSECRKAEAQLYKMSDRELWDLGISRYDIQRLVWDRDNK
ncbi:MAG: DUF1127 domain-containing protein [Candidatus Thiodiazotropha taylori]|nr:DUF1127 domain-containing protein [Candidatus Thiodiazotropha taylori]